MDNKKLVYYISLILLGLFFSSFIKIAEASNTPISSSLEKNFSTTLYLLNIEDKQIVAPLYINELGRTMISARELTRIFPCTIDWEDSNQVTITYANNYWLFSNNDFTYFNEFETKIMDTPPIIIKDEIYIPLRYIVEEFGYYINYSYESKEYYLSIQNIDTEIFSVKDSLNLPSNLPLWGTLDEVEVFTKPNMISNFYTTLVDNPNRTNNVHLAAYAIDNIIINPEETFSFNNIVGERTTSKGYQKAPIFVGKKVVDGVGGGICQVSSTLYNSALNANLPVTERHPHSLKVAYVPPNRDASVAWGTTDFKFKNNFNYPIKLLVKVVDKYVVTGIFKAGD